eukprot:COSAG02_NODE_5206_length_4543_cov_11.594140_3_plen_420_part_00
MAPRSAGRPSRRRPHPRVAARGVLGGPTAGRTMAGMPLLSVGLAAAAATRPGHFKFERPVLIGESRPTSVTGANFSHFWFPEAGGVVGGREHSAGQATQAVVAGVRFNGDGTPPLPIHTFESLVSWDKGATFVHLGWSAAIDGVSTHLDSATGDLIGSCCFKRSVDNTSFTGRAQRTHVWPNKTLETVEIGEVVYSGFPFPVARFTYSGAMVSTTAGSDTTLAQTVAYSHKMNEVGGADENLAGFRSTDGGRHWEFAQVIASHNATLQQEHWEGPGENDIVRLSDDNLLTVFRVDSCHPYWKSASTNGGKTWSAPSALPFGSARPKLLRMPNGQPLLAGGRPGVHLWLGDTTGSTWTPINVCATHNSLVADEPSWQYSQRFVNATTCGNMGTPESTASVLIIPHSFSSPDFRKLTRNSS